MTPELIAAVQKTVDSAGAHFFTPTNVPVTCCVLVLASGFTVVGKFAALDPSQFDVEMSRKLAFDDAVNEVIRLEAYRQATSGPRIEIATAADVAQVNRH